LAAGAPRAASATRPTVRLIAGEIAVNNTDGATGVINTAAESLAAIPAGCAWIAHAAGRAGVVGAIGSSAASAALSQVVGDRAKDHLDGAAFVGEPSTQGIATRAAARRTDRAHRLIVAQSHIRQRKAGGRIEDAASLRGQTIGDSQVIDLHSRSGATH